MSELVGEQKRKHFICIECQKCIFYEGTNLNTTVFTSPTGDGAATLSDHQSHAKVQPLAVQSLHFSVILRP